MLLSHFAGAAPASDLAVDGDQVARDPRFGRNSELPGEDPYLNGQVAVGYMKGIRAKDPAGHPLAVAYLKHFTAYSRETNRGHDTYEISAFDFGETYLPQYEVALREGGPGSYFNKSEAADGVMCSYNGENGAPSCANGWLLDDVMRTRWARPDAVVVTDSGAVLNLQGPPVNASSTALAAAMAINNGTDMNDGHGFAALADAVKQGLTTEAKVDTALKRALRQLFTVGLFDQPSQEGSDWTQTITAEDIASTEHQHARDDAALQSIVLLQNDPHTGNHPLLPVRLPHLYAASACLRLHV
jgi:beta-glucosidase